MKIAHMLGATGLAFAVAGAQATTFSFASDNDHTSRTFTGVGNVLTSALDPGNPQVLMVDDDNGLNPALAFNVEFRANFSLTHATSLNIGGGQFMHVYGVSPAVPEGPASFGFYNADGSPLLLASFSFGVYRNVGSAGAWGTGANFTTSDLSASVTYTWFGPDLPAYGLYTGQASVGLDDAAFTFTDLFSDAGPGVPLSNNYPSMGWASEGSFSGTAHFVPAPGLFAVAGAAGLLVSRRRR